MPALPGSYLEPARFCHLGHVIKLSQQREQCFSYGLPASLSWQLQCAKASVVQLLQRLSDCWTPWDQQILGRNRSYQHAVGILGRGVSRVLSGDPKWEGQAGHCHHMRTPVSACQHALMSCDHSTEFFSRQSFSLPSQTKTCVK